MYPEFSLDEKAVYAVHSGAGWGKIKCTLLELISHPPLFIAISAKY